MDETWTRFIYSYNHAWQSTLFTDSLFMQFYVALNKRVNVKLRKFYERWPRNSILINEILMCYYTTLEKMYLKFTM